MPLHNGGLVSWLLLEQLSVPCLVGLERVEGKAGIKVILAGVMERQLQDGVGHRPLINVLEVLESHVEHLVVEAAVVAEVQQYLPGLHDLAC